MSQQIAALPWVVRDYLQRHGFDEARLIRLAEQHLARDASRDRNRVCGDVRQLSPDDIMLLPTPGSAEHRRCRETGEDALRRGECAMVVLAGGMATRMGGIVKALAEALPGQTFLQLRLREQARLVEELGIPFPLWLMASHATEASIRRALGDRLSADHLAVFSQCMSLRLLPDGSLFLDANGLPQMHASGHGDLPDALQSSGLLQRFVDRGGRWVTVANLDNLGASLDPAVIGWHINHSRHLTCEVVDKAAGDRGGIPVRWCDKPVVLEEFRLPQDFDPASVQMFNTNTFHFDAQALLSLKMNFTFFTVFKDVIGQPVLQFERLLGEVTTQLSTCFLHVPRVGPESRFLAVKDHDELMRRRAEIDLVVRERGWL